MNYEELYEKLAPLEKDLKDSAGTVTRLQKAIQKNTDNGNLTEVLKALDQLSAAVEQLKGRVGAVQAEAGSFDTKAYVVSGDFAEQLVEICAEKGVDVKGEKGIYEMFPYKVRILGDEEHAEEVYINRKKIPSFRPSFVAETIRSGQEKLRRANFNEASFLNELADAYDTTCLKNNTRIGSSQSLTKVYKSMTPMARARKEYDMQAFAFDLARLYEKGTEAWVTKSGRQFLFGTSRDGKNGIRVLSKTGVEDYLLTLKSINNEDA